MITSTKSSVVFSRIQRLRLKQGWEWDRVAQELGVGKVMLHYVKTGKRNLSDKVMFRLQQAEVGAGLRAQEKQEDIGFADQEKLYKQMVELRKRWRRRPADRDEIVLALRVLFSESAETVLKWLQEGKRS